MASNSEWLARKLLELEQQVQALGRGTRLGHSSLQGGSILALDEDGKALAELGTDGVVHLDGPEPPRPTAPVLEQGVGTIFVRWDGDWDPLVEGDDGELPTTPLDFDRIEVHATTDPEATEWDEDTLAGSITQRNGGVVMIRGWDIDDVVYVRLVCRSLADKLSEPSERAEVTVTGIDIAAIVDELDAANVELANLDGTMFAANAELDALRIQFKNLDTSIINTDDGTLTEALEDARQALEDARAEAKSYTDQAIADIVVDAPDGTKTIYSLNDPTGEYVKGSTWYKIDTDENIIGQWSQDGGDDTTPAAVWTPRAMTDSMVTSLNAAKIDAGIIDAARIGAGSITADKLLIGGAHNLLPNGDLRAGNTAKWPDGAVYATEDPPPGLDRYVDWGVSTRTARLTTFGRFPVTLGDEIVVELWIKADKPRSRVFIEARDQDGAHIAVGQSGNWSPEGWVNGSSQYPVGSAVVPTEWALRRSRLKITNPDTTEVYLDGFYQNHSAGDIRDAHLFTSGIRLFKRVGSTLIEDGAITTDKISANAIGARAIAADAVEAGKIAADSISGREIIANTIKAEHIAAFTITADELAANSVSTDKLVANSVIADKIASNSVTAEKIAALAVTADKIAANAITADKIAANAITAGKIEAGAVTGEVLSADALNFKRAVGLELSAPLIKLGDAVEITEGHGIRQFGPDGALNVDLPSDGSPAALRGDFSARRLTAQHMQLSGDMAVAASAEVVLDPGVVAPAAAPQVSAHWPRVTLPSLTSQERAVGIARGEGHWWRLVTTSVPFSDGGRDRIEKIDLNGALVSEFHTDHRGAVGFTYLNGELHVLVTNMLTVVVGNGVLVYGSDGTYKRRYQAGGYLVGSYGTASPHRPNIGNDGTNVVIAQCNKDGVLNYWRRSPSTGALVSSHNTGDKFNADVRGLYIGSADFGGQKLLVAKQTPAGSTYRQLVVYDLPGHGYNSGLSWRTPNREAPAGLAYDGTFFWSLTGEGNLVRYSRREGTRVVGDDSANWWLSASWRNNPAESLAGPAQRFTWPHRSELLVTVPDIPQGVTGVAFFAARQTSEPVRTDLHWVAEINEAARTVIIPSMSGTWSNDRAPVSVSSFTEQQPGEIRSMAGNFQVNGLGAGTWGPLEFHEDGTMTGLPAVAGGRVSVPADDGTAGSPVTVTFPAGLFNSAPAVTLTADSSNPSSISGVTVRSVTTTSADIRLLRTGSFNTVVHWVAIERTD